MTGAEPTPRRRALRGHRRAVASGLPPLRLPAVQWADLNELLPLAIACFYYARPLRYGLALGGILLLLTIRENREDRKSVV